MTTASDPRGLEADVLARDWFYRFTLPSGTVTGSAHAPDILAIHDTRWAMAEAALRDAFPDGAARASAIDLACHQAGSHSSCAASVSAACTASTPASRTSTTPR